MGGVNRTVPDTDRPDGLGRCGSFGRSCDCDEAACSGADSSSSCDSLCDSFAFCGTAVLSVSVPSALPVTGLSFSSPSRGK